MHRQLGKTRLSSYLRYQRTDYQLRNFCKYAISDSYKLHKFS